MYYKAALIIQGMQEGASGGGRSLPYVIFQLCFKAAFVICLLSFVFLRTIESVHTSSLHDYVKCYFC